MLKSFSRLFVIYRGYRLKLIFSQVLLFISALCMIGVATLTQRLINDGIATNNIEVVLQTGIWMAVLAIVAGVATKTFTSLEDGVTHMVRVKRVYEPDMTVHERYTEKAQRFAKIYPTLAELNHQL